MQRLLREGKVEELVAAVKAGRVAAALLPGGGEGKTTTPLHCAVEARCPEACARLVAEAGLGVDAPNGKGQTALLLAARQDEGVEPLVRALVAAGADPLRKNKRGRDALGLCAEKGLVGLLLHLAQEHGGVGADRVFPERDGATLLHLLVAARDAAGVEALVRSGLLKPEAYRVRRGDAHMAHHLAGQQGDWPTLQLLVEAGGAPVKARDGHGMTVLHMAAAHGVLPVVEWLVTHGADVRATNSAGLMARDVAQAHHLEVAKYLGKLMVEAGWEDAAALADSESEGDGGEDDGEGEGGGGEEDWGPSSRFAHRAKRTIARSRREAQARVREERKALSDDSWQKGVQARIEEKREKVAARLEAEEARRRQQEEVGVS